VKIDIHGQAILYKKIPNESHDTLMILVSANGLSPQCCVLSGEPPNIKLMILGLTQPRLEPTIYYTRVDQSIIRQKYNWVSKIHSSILWDWKVDSWNKHSWPKNTQNIFFYLVSWHAYDSSVRKWG